MVNPTNESYVCAHNHKYERYQGKNGDDSALNGLAVSTCKALPTKNAWTSGVWYNRMMNMYRFDQCTSIKGGQSIYLTRRKDASILWMLIVSIVLLVITCGLFCYGAKTMVKKDK
jgi:hypothetical protein